jgi:Cu2+-exporting ATPase
MPGRSTVVLHTGGLLYSGEAAIVERSLAKRPGVLNVDANVVAQTATVTFDPSQTSVAALKKWVEECGHHCAGQSVPSHICDAMQEPAAVRDEGDHAGGHMTAVTATGHAGPGQMVMSPAEAMGHGGYAGMSMASMVRDMRNRFLVAMALSVPILLWSSIGRNVLHFNAPAPFGLRDDIFQLVLSLPVVFYSSWIFFDGAVRALRNRTLDMMVLVAVAIGAG